jgi:hypothetical protein
MTKESRASQIRDYGCRQGEALASGNHEGAWPGTENEEPLSLLNRIIEECDLLGWTAVAKDLEPQIQKARQAGLVVDDEEKEMLVKSLVDGVRQVLRGL